MDKYHLYWQVATGCSSQVFPAREKNSIEFVAIKKFPKRFKRRVCNELLVNHQLQSPNIVQFFDLIETSNSLWLILEYCAGGDLLTLIKQDQREPESAVRLFGLDLLAGLQHMHRRGFLHCDLKPSNVLVDEYGILKLSGFASARAIPTEADGGNNGHRRGTPSYMSPELFSDGGVPSFASDFWSLGCVLLELLTGSPAFGHAGGLGALRQRILHQVGGQPAEPVAIRGGGRGGGGGCGGCGGGVGGGQRGDR